MRGFADKRFIALAALVVWACAKANNSPLSGGSFNAASGGKGGSAGKGGSSASSSGGKGGSSASAGKGGSSASGGTGGSSANGGGSATGGSSATGGASGTGGTGGSGGTGGIDPDVLKNAEIVIHYINVNGTDHSSAVEMRLFVENKMDVGLDMTHVVVRYWMTAEAKTYMLNSYFQGEYLQKDVALEFVDDGADSHVKATFTDGVIPSKAELWRTEFQIKLDGTNGAEFEQGDDWSFAPTLKSDPAVPHDKITAYVDGTLVWGCEPSGKCPDLGMGGAGGQGGEGGQSGAAGAGTGGGGAGGSSAGGASGDTGMAGAGQGGA